MSNGPIVPVPGQVAPFVENTFTDGFWHLKVKTFSTPTAIPGLVDVTIQLSVGGRLFPPRIPGWSVNYGVDSIPPVSVGAIGKVSIPIMVGSVGFSVTARVSPVDGKTGVFLTITIGPGNLSLKLLPPTVPPDVKGWLTWGAGPGSGGIDADGALVVRFENVPGKPIETNLLQRMTPVDVFQPGLPPGLTMVSPSR